MNPAGSRFAADRPDPPPPRIPDHELLRLIGRGSYGEVWLGRSALGTARAIKIVHRARFDSDHPFEREFRGLQKFEPVSRQHEGLVDILHVGRGAGYFYTVMELADDVWPSPGASDDGSAQAAYAPRTLRSDLQQRGRLPAAECVAVARVLAEALDHLHRHGLIHRDVKPANIIFVGGVPKLADIGLVAEIDEARSFVGTSGYIPPEGPGTSRGDIYSLGKVLYEISTGRDRHEFPQLPADLRTLPDADRLLELNEIVLKACDADPAQRYASAADLAADVALLQAGRSVKRLRLIERRLAAVRQILLAVTLLLVTAAGLYLAASRQVRATRRQLYVADMDRAFRAWESGNVGRARGLLEWHRQRQPEMLGFEWHLAQALCREGGASHTLTGHTGGIECVAVSADGRWVATGGRDAAVCLWHAARGVLERKLDAGGIVHAVAFSPDGSRLVAGGRDQVIHVWEPGGGRKRQTLRGHTDAVRSLAFMPSGQVLVSGGEDRTLRFWDLDTGSERQAERLQDDAKLEHLALSHTGDQLATCGFSDRVRRWRLHPTTRLPDLESHTAATTAVAFSPDGQWLATAGHDGPVRLWDLKNDRSFGQLGRGAAVRDLAFSPQGQLLATATRDGLVHVWDLATRLEMRTLRGHAAEVSSLAFTPTGDTVVSGSDDRMAMVWTLAGRRPGAERLAAGRLVNSLVFTPGGDRLITAIPLDRLAVWETATGRQVATMDLPGGGIWCVAVAPDGRTVATGGVSSDTGVRLWNLESLEAPILLGRHEQGVETVAFSVDGRRVVSACRDGTIALWDVAQRRLQTTLSGGYGVMRCAVFSPDGRWLVAGSRDGLIRLWAAAELQEPIVWSGHQAEIWSVAFSHDGRWLASGDARRRVLLWDMRSRRLAATLEGQAACVSALAFSDDDRTLASGSWDSTVTLWNLQLRAEVGTLHGHDGPVTALGFAPGNTLLASSSGDGTVRLWRSAPRPEADPVP